MLNPVTTLTEMINKSTNVKLGMSAQVAQLCQKSVISDITLWQEVLNVKHVQKGINALLPMKCLAYALLVNTAF
jgi:hypothetical protein